MESVIDYTHCNMKQVAVHVVGNKTQEEELRLSKSVLDLSDFDLNKLLIRFFLQSFPGMEQYNFTFSNDDFTLNPIYTFATAMFKDADNFYPNSVHMARHLYEASVHPNIKSGDLFVAQFSNVFLQGEKAEVIGLFKSENRQPFLKLDREKDVFSLDYADGINVDKLDKGCLIFNLDRENGYKICILDKSNKSYEAQYWRDLFLQIKPSDDNFHHTKDFLTVARQYITKGISKEYEVSKAEKMDMLNKSLEYFNGHNTFNKADFEKQIFHHDELIDSFRNFDQGYQEKKGLNIDDNFEISSPAVKKQTRVFRSVLKLDKNFHIYVHGDSSRIEQGVEADGRKYYKIYYDRES